MSNSLKATLQSNLFKLLIVLFIAFQTSYSFGQDLDYIYGKIVDSKSERPLSFASIIQKDKSIGLISNSDGSFKIPSYYALADVVLEISFIGYYSEEIRVKDLDRKNLNVIKLVEKTESLDEIVISRKEPISAKQIVELAIKNIKNNYPRDQFSYVGYYRDYQTNKESNYLNLNEAILQVNDLGFHYEDYVSTKTNILKYAKNLDFPIDTLPYQLYDYQEKTKVNNNAILNSIGERSNEFALLRFHDAVRNYKINTYDYVNNLEKDFVPNHNFELVRETSVNDVNLYQIKFNRNLGKVLAEGEIFISKVDYKIYKLRYSVHKMKIKKNDSEQAHYAIRSKITQKKEELIYNITLEYKDYLDMMYPKYISFSNPFNVILPPKFFPTEAKFVHKKQKAMNAVLISVELFFNNEISEKGIQKKKNYSLKYKNKKIRLDSIQLGPKRQKLIFYPLEKDIFFYREAWMRGDTLPSTDFVFDVKNIEDVYGNVVLERESVSYNQFREFFIQELNFGIDTSKDTIFMNKNRPISDNQPINPSQKLSKYWMNTPLKE